MTLGTRLLIIFVLVLTKMYVGSQNEIAIPFFLAPKGSCVYSFARDTIKFLNPKLKSHLICYSN